jgi:hypothetical protein
MNMHIGKRAMLLAVPLAAAGLSIGVLPASAAHAAHAGPAITNHATTKPESVHITIQDVSTPDGSEPAFVGPTGVGARILFTAHVGQPVVMTVVNRSTAMHSFTAPGLGVNTMIAVGATVTIKFTPKKAGNAISWSCVMPCGDYVMSHVGYQKGYVKVAKS